MRTLNSQMLKQPHRKTSLWDVRTKHVTYENVPTLEHVRGIALYGPLAALFTLGPNNTAQQFDLHSPPHLVANVQHPANFLPPSPPVSIEEQPSSGSSPSLEIFKSFRVSMDDPCYKVLPAVLKKKYNIKAPWEHYALYIVYGDQERCLELNEKPLILFKQLDKEGKKPMFMLRKTTAHPDAAGAEIPGSADLDGSSKW
jgi:hypothetical protein